MEVEGEGKEAAKGSRSFGILETRGKRTQDGWLVWVVEKWGEKEVLRRCGSWWCSMISVGGREEEGLRRLFIYIFRRLFLIWKQMEMEFS